MRLGFKFASQVAGRKEEAWNGMGMGMEMEMDMERGRKGRIKGKKGRKEGKK